MEQSKRWSAYQMHTFGGYNNLLVWVLLWAMYFGWHVISAAECEFPAIFNFGDSNSDTGGLSAAFGPAPPPNGESFFHKPAGRYCDGRLIIDFLAEELGLPYLSAYLQSVGSNFSHGANFATAGSTVRRQNTTLFQSGFSPFSLDVQFWQFSEFKAKVVDAYNQGDSYKELLPKPDFFNKALYTFDIGQNDLTSGYFLGMTIDEVRAYIPDVLYRLSDIIKNIYGGGGRSFLIHNTGPIGCLPYILDRLSYTQSELDKNGCATPYNQVSQYFNKLLYDTVVQLRKDLPLAALTYVDIYALKYGLASNATHEGFKYNVRACCGYGGGKYNHNWNVGCGAKALINGSQVEGRSCKDPSVYVVWDGTHYTEASNHFIVRHIISGGFSDPPLPLSQHCPTSHN